MISVSACLVTRGDVDMSLITGSLMKAGIDEIVVCDNSAPQILIGGPDPDKWKSIPQERDLSVYGRYAAIEYASGDLIYVQDDDVIVSDPWAIVNTLLFALKPNPPIELQPVVCNMPEAHRSQSFYKEHALVGYGAVFHRDAPRRAFEKFEEMHMPLVIKERDFLNRRCDVLFTALTPRVLVDVPIRNLPYYDAPNRSWKQKDHFKERKRMLELALQVRDA